MALYPPIVASSMPAFDVNKGKVNIYFTLSEYNTARADEILQVHITVRRQSSNRNVLNSTSEIKIVNFNQTNLDKALNRYYVTISNDDLIENFQADALYKVQLRFSSVSASSNSISADFFTSNVQHFSEWSTVCIIKPVILPSFYIQDFEKTDQPSKKISEYQAIGQTDVTSSSTFTYNLADFVGIYNKGESSETLKEWRIRLLKGTYNLGLKNNIDSYTLSDSGWTLFSAYNYVSFNYGTALECSLPYEFSTQDTDKDNQGHYKLLFEIKTINDYSDGVLYDFNYTPLVYESLPGKLTTSINEEEGFIKIIYTDDTQTQIEYTGNLVLRRSDSKSNFLKWEDLKNFENKGTAINFSYYDFTAQSGLAYRYLLQKRDARGRRGTPLYDRTYYGGDDPAEEGTQGYQPVTNSANIAEWEHAFLLETTGNGNALTAKQLKLKYDFQISSYKTNIAESKTDTIGSRYPFIRRNGSMYYRSFPCSGTITGYMDEAELFVTKDELYDNRTQLYQEFRGGISKYVSTYDYTYERKFREKVEQFLYNSKPKLYKSMQEGNIFIKLMQVSLTPKNELGRLVYSFSATAYEIDQACINTYNNYGLLSIGQYNPTVSVSGVRLGQLNTFDSNTNQFSSTFEAGKNIIGTGSDPAANSIAKALKYNEIFNRKIVTDFNLKWLRITVESKPYLIVKDSTTGKFKPFEDDKDKISNPIDKQLYQIEQTYNQQDIYLGTLFDINGQQIIIGEPNNIYEINEKQFQLGKGSNITPAKNTQMTIDYIASYSSQQDVSNVPKTIDVTNTNGQILGLYDGSSNLINEIKNKYAFSINNNIKTTMRKYVSNIQKILVDTEPGTVIKIKTSVESQEEEFIVNETGELEIDTGVPTISIDVLKVLGIPHTQGSSIIYEPIEAMIFYTASVRRDYF